jgi:WD40 repeat protein
MSQFNCDDIKNFQLTSGKEFTGLAFCQGGKKLAIAVEDGSLEIIDLNTWKLKSYPKVGNNCLAFRCQFTSDAKHVVSGGGGNTIIIRDIDDDAPQRAVTFQTVVHVKRVIKKERAVSHLPKHIAELILTYNRTPRAPRVIDMRDNVRCFEVSRDCKTIVTADYNNHVETWDFDTGKRKSQILLPVYTGTLAIVDDAADQILVGTKGVVLLETSVGNRSFLEVSRRYDINSKYVDFLELTSDRKQFVCADDAGRIDMWDIASGEWLCRIAETERISCLKVIADGTAILVCDKYQVAVQNITDCPGRDSYALLSWSKNTQGDACQIGDITIIATRCMFSGTLHPQPTICIYYVRRVMRGVLRDPPNPPT